MRKLHGCLLSIFLLLGIGLFAQNSEITGKITDPTGSPIPNASIRIKGVKGGTSADVNGEFKIRAAGNATLIASAVGFEPMEIQVNHRTSVTFALRSANLSLSEVVVTALGVKREKKSLGYAVTTVGKQDVELRPEEDVSRILQGKTPGVDILATSGISGSGTNISIRGISTISGGPSAPLFVVDGVPFDASSNVNNSFQYGGGISSTSRFLDLDANDIESVSVLKGLAAATLYGEAGRNGVILVTTKGGSGRKTNRKMEITGSQSLFANQVANLPDYTSKYGGGFDLAPSAAFSNWGPLFTNPPLQVSYSPSLVAAYPQYAGKTQDFRNYNNNVRDFFRTGLISTTSVNVGASGPNTTFNANYTYMADNGFTPNNRVFKNNFGIGGTAKLANNFTANATLNFAITDMQTPTVGANGGGGSADVASVFGDLIFTPRSVNLMGLPYQNPVDGSSVYYRNGNDIENPRWTAANDISGDKTYRTFGTFALKYDIVKGLAINYRFGLDLYQEYQSLMVNKGGKQGGPGYVNGLYRTTNLQNSVLNNTAYLTYSSTFAQDFSLDLETGFDMRHDRFSQNGQKSTQQIVFGLFDHSNFISHDIVDEGGSDLDYKSEEIREGVFGQATIGYKDFVYVTGDARNDWVSTLEPAHRTQFYPGVSASFIPTALLPALQRSKVVNYLKLRLGYATSAHFPTPYNTRPYINLSTNSFVDKNGNVINVASIPSQVPNPNLRPELIKETEAGIEGKFFDSRLGIDLTGYFRTAQNQILNRQLDASTGYSTTTINAGAVDNKGIEASVTYTVIRNKNVNWDLTGNFFLNRSKVHDLPADIKQIELNGGGYTNLGGFAINGKPLGILEGSYTQRDPKSGKKIVDNNGYFLSSSDIAVIGDPTPRYKLTGISVLTWRYITFRIQFDYTHGGKMWSNTVRTMLARGVTKDTDFDRTLPFTIPNTVKQDGTPNDIQQSVDNIYFNSYGFGPNEESIWDATVIRLREASLAFAVPAKLLKGTPFGAASFSVSGTNLWYLAPYFPKYTRFDPEVNSLGVTNAKGLDFFAGPSSRRFGASLRLSF
ncbi:MAG TPA: SusC/RagA family TonB-linked outer membrane protein [Puia sp.]|uniref:SusC/RagA family TonB-linked outer membrane protein n=1 Tax=Puia sp. TaxID=2045100 RepID=UPI002CEB0E7C|nr:SusC/RagA family TonB-linked outer membrane protein [Puia sp.]HVU97494.1 SusC/RagA family TonB-linked outer membrane protein [Puia sp.]